MAFINIGYGNIVNTEKIISVINYEAAPIKRMVQLQRMPALPLMQPVAKRQKLSLLWKTK